MALELAPKGIRVNAIAPGVMLTSMTEQTRKDPKHVEYILRRIPMKRYGEPAEIAGPVAFLASPWRATSRPRCSMSMVDIWQSKRTPAAQTVPPAH